MERRAWSFVRTVLFCAVFFFSGGQDSLAQLRYVTEAHNGRTIVFIHGFMGDPLRTFSAGAPHKSWPEIMREDTEVLGAAMPLANYSTATLKYPADLGDKALTHWDAAIALNRSADSLFWKGRTLFRLNRTAEAQAAYKEALAVDPSHYMANKAVTR